MKRYTSLLFFAVLLTGQLACSSQQDANIPITKTVDPTAQTGQATAEQDVRKDVWDQLAKEDRARIKGTWKEGTVLKRTLTENMGFYLDKSYLGKEVYLVDFPTKSKAMPNNMILFAAPDNHKLIGYGYVD